MSADRNPGRGIPPPNRRENKVDLPDDPYHTIKERLGRVSSLGDPLLLALSDFSTLVRHIPDSTFAEDNPTELEILLKKAPPDMNKKDIEHSAVDYYIKLLHNQIRQRRRKIPGYKSAYDFMSSFLPRIVDYEQDAIAVEYDAAALAAAAGMSLEADALIASGVELDQIRDDTIKRIIGEDSEKKITENPYKEEEYTTERLYGAIENEVAGATTIDDPRIIALTDVMNITRTKIIFRPQDNWDISTKNVFTFFAAQTLLQERLHQDTVDGYAASFRTLRLISDALMPQERKEIEERNPFYMEEWEAGDIEWVIHDSIDTTLKAIIVARVPMDN